jgi:PAS domain S-box-containing protein
MFERIFDKTTIILLFMILIFSGCSILYISDVTSIALKDQARYDLGAIATIIADQVNGDTVNSIQPGDEQTTKFTTIRDQLYRIQQSNPEIRYVYIMRKSGDNVEFVVDSEYGISDTAAPIGQKYSQPTTEMLEGFGKVSVEKEAVTDTWGTFISGYSPIKDSSGNVVGIVGVDMDQATVIARQNLINTTSYMIIFLAILMAGFGVLSVEGIRSINLQDLKNREARYRTLFESTYNGIFILRDGLFADCNSSALFLFNGQKDKIIGKRPSELSSDVQDNRGNSEELMREKIDRALAGDLQIFEWKFKKADGTVFDSEVNLNRITIGNAVSLQMVVRDITEKKKAEDAIHESEEKYRTVIESSPNAIFVVDKNNTIIYANSVASNISSKGLSEIIGKQFYGIFPLGNLEDQNGIINTVLSGGPIQRTQDKIVMPDGREIWLDNTFTPFKNNRQETFAVLVISHDITDHKVMEKQIKSALNEKEYLLKEVHHRVKNNLQIIISLLNLQSRFIKDETALSVIKDSQNRIKAMALVHEKLYKSDDISKINLNDYIRFLGNNLFDYYGMKGKGITLKTDIKEIFLDINTAIPAGLIINELISNSLKYAFPAGREGAISITIRRKGHTLTVLFKDNGVGIPEDFDWRNAKSLGLRLVISFVEQLNGTIELDRTDGTAFTVVVREKA